MERQASNATRSRIGFHHTLCHGLAKGRRGLTQGCRRLFDLLLGHGRLDFLDEALERAQSRTVTVMPLDSLTGSVQQFLGPPPELRATQPASTLPADSSPSE